MALITCPECYKEISDKAETCPSCGYPIKGETNALIICPECHKKISKTSETCPKCGSSIKNIKKYTKKNHKETLLFMGNLLLSVIFIGLAVFLAFSSWKVSLIWFCTGIYFSPQMKNFLVQKRKWDSRTVAAPKLFILIFAVIGSLIIIPSEYKARQKAMNWLRKLKSKPKLKRKNKRFWKIALDI